MDYKETNLDSFLIVGIAIRTTNKDGQSQKDINNLWNEFMYGQIPAYIPHKVSDDVYCVYTDYDSDFTGEYTTILGFKVSSANNLPEELVVKEIPASNYQVYDTSGKIPDCVLDIWTNIWQKPDVDRVYRADFEVYDAKAQDPENSKVSVFLSVK
ncbi:AraC family transcriptional regulator [Dysgonomonas sp. 216]|uniref:GyrI-like domain-containing protein n=1 Tax=Dysgonomonas sp. 216 TaxID=2302934 RepID=UPI0013D15E8B|nr:GyrI-like domain-containing protein [Dysgonomonas sp. 216]NDW18806.1 AraC family transcriptional regulator [Dysgonomonas sp. 216]